VKIKIKHHARANLFTIYVISFLGKFRDLIKFDINTFVTTIPKQLNLPPLTHIPNISEGIVLKPVINRYTFKGSRVIVKYKSENFKEVTGLTKQKNPKPKKDILIQEKPMDDHLKEECNNLMRYVTENRLKNVISKIGQIGRNDKSKLIGLLAKDALKDYESDHPSFKELPKKDQKRLTGKFSEKVQNIVNKNFERILENDF